METPLLKTTIDYKKELLDGLDDLRRDEEHGLENKIYLPYSLYYPEQED